MIRLFCPTILLALVVGCGNGNVGLKGKVTFSDDGSPLTTGTVAFRKDGKVAYGTLKADGTYVVGFEKEADGLPPGRYQVYISGADKQLDNGSRELLIGRKYTDANKSGLVLDVDASTREYNIEVERYKK